MTEQERTGSASEQATVAHIVLRPAEPGDSTSHGLSSMLSIRRGHVVKRSAPGKRRRRITNESATEALMQAYAPWVVFVIRFPFRIDFLERSDFMCSRRSAPNEGQVPSTLGVPGIGVIALSIELARPRLELDAARG